MSKKVKDPSILGEDGMAAEILLGGTGDRPRIRFLRPEQVLGGRVSDRESLLAELVHRQHNSIDLHTGDISTRRWHLERERPALRFYCRKFGVPVPNWLEGCGGYEDLSQKTFTELFGNQPLRPLEFKTWGELFPELQAK